MLSTNATYKLNEQNSISAEIANSTKENLGNDVAGRVEIKHRSQNMSGRIYVGRSGNEFFNQYATLGQGRTEGGLRGNVKIGNKINLQAEALYSKSDTSGAYKRGAMISLQQGFTNYLQGEIGIRHSEADVDVTDNTIDKTISFRSRITSNIPTINGLQLFGEYEQSVNKNDRRIAALGGDYRLGNWAKLYARHEFISSMNGAYALNSQQQQNNTVFGVDAAYMKNGRVYSEYRSRDAFDGRSTQASIGLQNQYQVTEGLGLTASFERVYTIEGSAANESMVVALGLDYTGSPDWKLTTNGEARFSSNGNVYLSSIGYGHRLTNEWSFLAKNTLALQKSGRGNRTLERMRVGFAYRDAATLSWNTLGRYELKLDNNNTLNEEINRVVHIGSLHSNWRAADRLVFSGRYSAKYATESTFGETTSSFLHMVSGRMIYDLTDAWDVGISTSALTDANLSSIYYGIGAEIGFVVAKNLRFAIGFNLFGFTDEDLTESEYTAKGVYLGFAYKFDEETFYDIIKKKPEEYPDLECPVCTIETFDMPTFKVPDLTIAKINLRPLVSLFYIPEEVHFSLDRSDISLKSTELIDKVVNYLYHYEEAAVVLEAHTDSRNSDRYNYFLSQRRAQAVHAYLVAAGIDTARIQLIAMGEYSLKEMKEPTIVHEAENRRVVFNIVNPSSNLRVISQVEDLQIEESELAFARYWKYLASTELNTVPDRINFRENKYQINEIHNLVLTRISAQMQKRRNLKILLTAYLENPRDLVESRVKSMMSVFENKGIDLSRIDLQIIEPDMNARDKYSFKMRNEAVFIDFIPPTSLNVITQVDDVLGRKATYVPQALKRLADIQYQRDDLILIQKGVKTNNYIPESIHFGYAKSELDHISKALLVRVAQFMLDNPQAIITLTGHTDSQSSLGRNVEFANARVKSAFDYLKTLGINATRVSLGISSSTPEPEKSEYESALNRKVTISVMNIDDITLIKHDIDVKLRR